MFKYLMVIFANNSVLCPFCALLMNHVLVKKRLVAWRAVSISILFYIYGLRDKSPVRGKDKSIRELKIRFPLVIV